MRIFPNFFYLLIQNNCLTAFHSTCKEYVEKFYPEEFERHEKYNDWNLCSIQRNSVSNWAGFREHKYKPTQKPASHFEPTSQYMIYFKNLFRQNLTFHQDISTEDEKRQKYKRISYPCVKCDHKCDTVENIEAHMDDVHDGIRYFCDICDDFRWVFRKTCILRILMS